MRMLLFLVSLTLATLSVTSQSQGEEPPIDFDKARQLFERAKRGETVSEEDRAYVKRAMQARPQGTGDPARSNAPTGGADFDMEKVRTLHQRRQSGDTLSAEDEAYLKRAIASRGGKLEGSGKPTPSGGSGSIDTAKARALLERKKKGDDLNSEDDAFVRRAVSALGMAGITGGGKPSPPTPWTKHLTPLTEFGTGKYKGQDGGLYGSGVNEPPKSHRDAALKLSALIRPLDAEGAESAEGKIGLISIGLSNTTQEYSRFKQLADADPAKSKGVIIVDTSQNGQTAQYWADTNATLWQTVDERLKNAGLSAKQVQVAWMKQAEAGPAQFGDFPEHAKQLEGNLMLSLANLKQRFSNLRIVYLSSRIYAGYATTALNPEPYAYEEAFSMRGLIQDQIAEKPGLNYDAARGPVQAPLLLWGPYLWTDGETPRKSDGLNYTRNDLSHADGTHPTQSGQTKVASLLLTFLKNDATAKTWFVK